MTRYKVWDWRDLWIYAFFLAAAVAALVAAVIKDWGRPGPLVAGLVLVVGTFICWRKLDSRMRFYNLIRGYTSQGVGVVPHLDVIQRGELQPTELVMAVGTAVERAIVFWQKVFPDAAHYIRKSFEGRFVEFMSVEKIRYGAATYGGHEGSAVTAGNFTGIAWPPGRDWEEVSRLLAHEFGHCCLLAAGVKPGPGQCPENHAALFVKHGWR